MGIFNKKKEIGLSIYDKAFLDKVMTTLEFSRSQNILEISDINLKSQNVYDKFGCFVDHTTLNIDGGIYDKTIIYNPTLDFNDKFRIARAHTDGQIIVIFTKEIPASLLSVITNKSPKSQMTTENYSLFIF